jgi:hypothetical protein
MHACIFTERKKKQRAQKPLLYIPHFNLDEPGKYTLKSLYHRRESVGTVRGDNDVLSEKGRQHRT